MKAHKYLLVIALLLIFVSCGTNSGQKKQLFSIKTNANKGNILANEVLKLTIDNKKNRQIDSINYQLNGVKISNNFDLTHHKLGKYAIDAIVYFENEKQTITSPVTILSSIVPKVFKYEIINEYPHDTTSYTQGLEFHNGKLYEGSGHYGESKLMQIDYKTGKAIKSIDLDKAYFGEGITILNNKIYQLTWRKGTGFIYDIDSFEKTGSFNYGDSKEGWGLCHFENTIYKSDGTENIWTLNHETLVEENHIQVYTNRGKIKGLNELEWIDGKIYANRYEKNGVAIINPKNGAVIGVVDFSPLKDKVKQPLKIDEVLNGIAYNPETKTIFITGKHWSKLFEVKIIE